MPAIALVGAIASVSAGAAAWGAATTLGSMLISGAAIAGGVMTGVGVVTGNKKLQTFGSVLSLGAGAASMLGAGSMGGAVPEWASNMGAGANAAKTAGLADVASASQALAPMPNMGDTKGLISQAAAPTTSLDGFYSNPAMGAPRVAPSFGELGSGSYAAQEPIVAAIGAPVAQTAAPIRSILQPQASAGGVAAGNAAAPAEPLGDFASKTLAFLRNKNNAELLKAGSGLVQGAMGSYAQQQQQEQILAEREAARRRFNQSILEQYGLKG